MIKEKTIDAILLGYSGVVSVRSDEKTLFYHFIDTIKFLFIFKFSMNKEYETDLDVASSHFTSEGAHKAMERHMSFFKYRGICEPGDPGYDDLEWSVEKVALLK